MCSPMEFDNDVDDDVIIAEDDNDSVVDNDLTLPTGGVRGVGEFVWLCNSPMCGDDVVVVFDDVVVDGIKTGDMREDEVNREEEERCVDDDVADVNGAVVEKVLSNTSRSFQTKGKSSHVLSKLLWES